MARAVCPGLSVFSQVLDIYRDRDFTASGWASTSSVKKSVFLCLNGISCICAFCLSPSILEEFGSVFSEPFHRVFMRIDKTLEPFLLYAGESWFPQYRCTRPLRKRKNHLLPAGTSAQSKRLLVFPSKMLWSMM